MNDLEKQLQAGAELALQKTIAEITRFVDEQL
jgi:hypothetical protein